MARKSLAALVGDELASGTGLPDSGTPQIPESGPNRVTELRTPERPNTRTSNGRNSQSHDLPNSRGADLRDSVPAGVPKYLRLVRKEARLSADQFDALTDLARRLNRRKPKGVGERITENTLIRVAVELLLAQADRVEGTTEDELLASLR
jgi:hypothetical protein